MNQVKEVIFNRFSQRNMDENKKIKHEDMQMIIDAGLTAPSGYGIEPWKFIIISGDKTSIAPSCLNQPVVSSCSHLVVCLYAKKGIFKSNPQYVSEISKIHKFEEDTIKMIEERLQPAWESSYMKEQLGYPVMQMVLMAESIGIQSVIMGGLDETSLAKDLNVDLEQYGILMNVAFGYGKDDEKLIKKHRPQEFVTEWIKL